MRASFYVVVCSGYAAMMQAEAKADKKTAH